MIRYYKDLGRILNVSALAAGAVSAQSTPFFGVESARWARVYVKTDQACEVYFYTCGEDQVFDWGNLLGSVSGTTGGAWATITNASLVPFGKGVKWAVKNTGASPANIELKVQLFGDVL